jgi:hypothetical protein
MTLFNSLLIAVIILGVICFVFVSLSYRKKIKSALVNNAEPQKGNSTAITEIPSSPEELKVNSEASQGELALIGVEESTAAIIIATVADHLQVPLNELQFKSIKALD